MQNEFRRFRPKISGLFDRSASVTRLFSEGRNCFGGLSRLAVWWTKLGITHERTQAGHPEQNGRHERMHRTLKQEVKTAADGRSQNASWIVSVMTSTRCAPTRRSICRRQQVFKCPRCGLIWRGSRRSDIRTGWRCASHLPGRRPTPGRGCRPRLLSTMAKRKSLRGQAAGARSA